jgi:hypothetical protein
MSNNKAREINSPIIKQLIEETTPEELAKIDAEMTNNKQDHIGEANKMVTTVKWLIDELIKNHGIQANLYSEFEQASEMEVMGREMSYDEGYAEGYKRALELTKWAISNLTPPHNESNT